MPSYSYVRRDEEYEIPVHSSAVTVLYLVENERWFSVFHFVKIIGEIIK